MDICKLSKHTLSVLKKNGWFKSRHYDISYWLSELTDEGYQINDYAQLVLHELGDIHIREKCNNIYAGVTLDFNPFHAANGEYDRMEEFEKISKDSLFPIGALQDYIVYAGVSKKIYLGDWEGLYFVGNSIEEYLENIFIRGFEPVRVECYPENEV